MIENYLERKEEEENIKTLHDVFCEENLKKLDTITSIKEIQKLISNYNKQFINYSYLSHEFNNKCEGKIYELNKKIRLKEYFADHYDNSTENYNEKKLQDLKRLRKEILEENDQSFFDEIRNKVQKSIENLPELPEPTLREQATPLSQSSSSLQKIPGPVTP